MPKIIVREEITYTFNVTPEQLAKAQEEGLEHWFTNKEHPVTEADQFEVHEREINTED